ncbi:MAG: hypothetical protein EOP49_19475 [Sphingobacteriales bacterium]|nr:MAG: hypothetical protein EOP49_19475 [Sphingobacteriales bacterium]
MTCAVMSRRHVFLITPKLYSLKSLDHGLKRFNRPILPLDMAASFCLGSPTTLTSKICRKCLNMSISFGYDKFLDNKGYPAITPPWGTLTAIDMNTGKHLWNRVLGEFKELSRKGIAPTGTENYGGPTVTAGGLLFIAATKDGMFRAFDKNTGKLLWETELPAAGYATPSTYEVNGKQYVVVACGGGKLGTKKGDSYVAFAL